MHQNYPNPFNPSTTITFDLPAASLVRMVVYNLLGQEIATLYDAGTVAGTHRVTWDGRDRAGRVVAAGLYLIRFTATGMEGGERFSQMGKMLLVK
jgi:NCAIR mutase (PurE)-related protein